MENTLMSINFSKMTNNWVGEHYGLKMVCKITLKMFFYKVAYLENVSL